ncbi:MAG TPA: hypothetical protein VHW24_17430 [Bryobacteraceae bacterium]|nr:hypothetical protein [Bryobacteraceae bacterium]
MHIDRRQFLLTSAAASLLRAADEPAAAAKVRGMMRLFVSDVEDKPWFNDRDMWPAYFSMLAENHFNRFQLALGIGYDFLREVTDAYFVFAYPFLMDVPGYQVRAVGLDAAERDRNLETLAYISKEAAAHGLNFQLGLWMHGYEWANSPHANYTIAGLNAENHGPYCRDALSALLRACPSISGVTFRIHGESGVTEGSYDFWKTVFDGAVRCGRKVNIDMHAKGIDQRMIDVALATRLPVTVSPKFVAEHMGMPYHQAAIRETEMPKGARTGLMALSTGTRSFTRYSFADLMREDRKYGVLHRVWPGTQRLLMWGDPVTAAGYARTFEVCGSLGAEFMEPLSFKGRRGSGLPGGRCAYADPLLNPHWDWQKYHRTYHVLGAALYNREARVEPKGLDRALASASRILPIVTSTHAPSAANNTYWPEMYTIQAMVEGAKNNIYTDTPAPRTFGAASPFDPQLFCGVNEFASELLKGEHSGKYSPIEAATWLEELARDARAELAKAGEPKNVDERRLAIDVRIQAGLGEFFAKRFRAGVLYAILTETGDQTALEEALKMYRSARATWSKVAEDAAAYAPDVTVGEQKWLRGHWRDRLPAMDADIEAMAKKAAASAAAAAPNAQAKTAIATALESAARGAITCTHTPASSFHAKAPLTLEIAVPKSAAVRLWYRHFDQAERWQSAETAAAEGGKLRGVVPAAYTDSPFPLQYYFEVRVAPDKAWIYPGFDATRANQPYYLVRPA